MLRANILSPWYHLNSVKPLSSAQNFQCLISVTGDPGESYYGFSSLLQDGFGIRFAKARTSRLLSVASGILTISFHRIFMILFLINYHISFDLSIGKSLNPFIAVINVVSTALSSYIRK